MICHAILCRILAMLCDVMLSDCICRCRRCLRRSARWSTRLFMIITTPPACSTTSIVRYPSLPSLFFLSDCSLCSVLRFISVLLVRLPCSFAAHAPIPILALVCTPTLQYTYVPFSQTTNSVNAIRSPYRLRYRYPPSVLILFLYS